VFLAAQLHGIPRSLLHNLKHNKVLHEQVILVTVRTLQTPTATPSDRIQQADIGLGIVRVKLNYGFTEKPDLPRDLIPVFTNLTSDDGFSTTYFLSHETVRVALGRYWWQRVRRRLFAIMIRDESSAAVYFGLPPNQVIEIGAQHEL
jgi:KUP system potassium uptake protein